MSKHNKKRNTGFIYEALVREVIKQSINKNKEKRNLVIKMIKDHFNKDTLLYQDLHLYKSITETSSADVGFATKVLKEVISKKKEISKKDLFTEQSKIISKINKIISNSVFTNYVPSYKHLASIGMLFNDNLKPKAKVLLEQGLIENMTSEAPLEIKKVHKLDSAVIGSFLKRFNHTYGDVLLREQKELLNKYISSAASLGAVEFKLFIDQEINRLKKALDENKEHQEVAGDNLMNKKFKKVLFFLNETHKHPLNETFILKITQIQQLVHEITTDD